MIESVMHPSSFAVITKFPPRMPSRWKPALKVLVNGSSDGGMFTRAMVINGTDPVQIIVPGFSVPLAVTKNIPWRKTQLDIDVISIDVTFTKVMKVTRYKNVVLDYHSDHLHLAKSLGYAVEDIPVEDTQKRLDEITAEDKKRTPDFYLTCKTYGEWMQGRSKPEA